MDQRTRFTVSCLQEMRFSYKDINRTKAKRSEKIRCVKANCMKTHESINIRQSRLRDKERQQEYRETSYQDKRVNSSRGYNRRNTQSKTGTIKRPSKQIHKYHWRWQCASRNRWTMDRISGGGAGSSATLSSNLPHETPSALHPGVKECTFFSERFSNLVKPDTGEAAPLSSVGKGFNKSWEFIFNIQ